MLFSLDIIILSYNLLFQFCVKKKVSQIQQRFETKHETEERLENLHFIYNTDFYLPSILISYYPFQSHI